MYRYQVTLRRLHTDCSNRSTACLRSPPLRCSRMFKPEIPVAVWAAPQSSGTLVGDAKAELTVVAAITAAAARATMIESFFRIGILRSVIRGPAPSHVRNSVPHRRLLSRQSHRLFDGYFVHAVCRLTDRSGNGGANTAPRSVKSLAIGRQHSRWRSNQDVISAMSCSSPRCPSTMSSMARKA